MEVDEADLEQSLLQQFSCLGTTDHDELVGKFQKLLGNQLNYATARFFLDMNNWNLQAAVGCYFDFYSGQKLPSMQIIADITVGEGEEVLPNTTFQQSWRVQNNGDERWPEGCYVKLASAEGEQIPVPAINPGENTVITVQLISPNEFGSFQTKWRLCTPNGSNFGDTFWAIVTVSQTGTLSITQQLSELHTNGTSERSLVVGSTVQNCFTPPNLSTTIIQQQQQQQQQQSQSETQSQSHNSIQQQTSNQNQDDNDMC